MAAPVDAGGARVSREATVAVHDMELAVVPAFVGHDELDRPRRSLGAKPGRATPASSRMTAPRTTSPERETSSLRYLTAPPVMPLMKRSRKRLYAIATGTLAISAAPISSPQ